MLKSVFWMQVTILCINSLSIKIAFFNNSLIKISRVFDILWLQKNSDNGAGLLCYSSSLEPMPRSGITKNMPKQTPAYAALIQ